MTVNVQVAVQGGGAKLCLLLAALDALQRLEQLDERPIRVTRLSGTSAGAIAAALFAAEVPFQRVRDYFQQKRPTLLKHARHPSWTDLPRVLRGKPIAEQDWLRETLDELFVDRDRNRIATFGDLKRPLFVVATNVTNGLPHVYGKPGDQLINALLSSAAIPFYFRGPVGPNSGDLIVDGGLCENLPVDVLRDGATPEHGPILGVTFRPGKPSAPPQSTKAFAMALVDTMMNHSVERARAQLPKSHLLRLPAAIETFEFEKALDQGLGDLYQAVLGESTMFFQSLAADLATKAAEEAVRRVADAGVVAELARAGAIAAQRTVQVVTESNRDAGLFEPTRQRMGEIYAALYEHDRQRYHDVRVVVRVRAPIPRNDGTGRGEPDTLRYRLRFEPAGDAVRCLRVLVDQTPTMEFLETLRTDVYDRFGKPLGTIPVLAEEPHKTNRRGYLLFFNPPVRPPASPDIDAGPYTLEYTHKVQGLMQDLIDDRVSHLEIGTRRAANHTPRVELIALVPVSFPNVTIHPSEKSTADDDGRQLSLEELRTMGITWEPDEYPLAWVGENVPPGVVFAAKLRAPDR